MKYSRKRIGLAIMLAQSAMVIPFANAQIEEVIITAERREASLQDTDIAITAFSEDTLREMGVSSYLDLSATAPNIMTHEMPGKAGGAISIRGFKNAETIATFEPKVGLYVDGVIIAKGAGSVFDVLDLERVEILRGPQGTLYGRNTAGGAVNFITKKPAYELGGKISATLGDYGQKDLKGVLNVPLIEDQLAVKATVGSMKSDGYWTNAINGEDLGDKDRQVARIQALWEPGDTLSLLYTYDMSDIDDGMYPLATVAFNPNSPAFPLVKDFIDDGSSSKRFLNRTGTFMEAEVDGHSLTANWDINDNLSLVSITGLRSFQVDNTQDSDHLPITLLNNDSGDDAETLTEEIRLVGSAMNDRLDFVLGGFYMDEDIKRSYTKLGLGSGTQLLTDASAQNEIWAVFGEATFAFTDQLDLTLGARHTAEDKTMTRFDTTTLASGTIIPLPFPEAQRDFDNDSLMGSLSYKWTEDAMTYFKVSQGYVSGGFNPRSPTTDFAYFTEGYNEEELINYELGWKTTWLDNRLQVNGAAFYTDYKDLQVNQLTQSGRNNIENAGDAEMRGLELEVIGSINDSLEVGGSYGYLDPQYNTYINDQGQDLSNNHFASAPENTFNTFARYQIPNFQDIGDLTFRLDYIWVDDYFLLTENSPGLIDGNVAPSYETINARMTLDKMKGPNNSDVSVSLWGRNLTDELYYTSGFDLSLSFGFVGKAPAPPRTFGVDLNVEF